MYPYFSRRRFQVRHNPRPRRHRVRSATPRPPTTFLNHFFSRVRYDNGDFYEGGLKKGLRSGSGVFVSTEGLQYKGEFSNNL